MRITITAEIDTDDTDAEPAAIVAELANELDGFEFWPAGGDSVALYGLKIEVERV